MAAVERSYMCIKSGEILISGVSGVVYFEWVVALCAAQASGSVRVHIQDICMLL